MPDIRLVALDLDGTVFNDEKEITPRTLEAIRAAIAKGVDVIPATGRVASGVPEAFLRIPGVRYALTSNGASVVELSTGKPLVNLPFDAALASDIYDIVAATGGAMGIFIGGKAYTDYFGANDGLALMPPALRRYLRDSRIVVDDMHAVFAAHPHEVEKFSITYRDNAARDAAWQAVASRFNVEITSSIPNNMEINAPGVTKGSGLKNAGRYPGPGDEPGDGLRRFRQRPCHDPGRRVRHCDGQRHTGCSGRRPLCNGRQQP